MFADSFLKKADLRKLIFWKCLSNITAKRGLVIELVKTTFF